MESIQDINKLLIDGNSIAQVEKILGYGKDTLRKKLNRLGYKFNRETKQYEYVGAAEQVEKLEIKKVPKKEITKLVTDSYMPKVIEDQEPIFKQDEIEILHKLIREYQLKQDISSVEIENDRLDNRNVRVYVEHFKMFSNWCKSMNVTQADMLKKAIDMLMSKYK